MYPIWLYPGPPTTITPNTQGSPSASRFLLQSTNPRTWREAVDTIADFKAEAAIVPWWTVFWTPFCMYTVRALKRRGIPTLFLCHNIADHETAWWKQRLARLALVGGSAFITHTEQDRCRLKALLPAATVVVHPHPRYQHFPPPVRVPRRRAALELLFFGYIRPYKGVDLLIEALGHCPELDFHLHIAGEFWVDQAPLQHRIKQLGIADRVTLTPRYVDDQEAAELITAADALVLPYREATGSGVAALALHYHTPVIATRVGGLAETIVDGETGYLVSPGDPAELASGILRLLQPRDWNKLIAAHQQAATWDGLAAAVIQSIAAIRLPAATKAPRSRRS